MALAIEDAIGLPRAKDIGAWVASTAKLTLEARAQLVQIVEASSHKMPAAQQTSDPVLAKAIEEAERRRENAEMATDVGGGGMAPLSARPRSSAPIPVSALAGPPRAPGEESTELATVQSTIHPFKQRSPSSRAAVALAVVGGSALVIALGVALWISRAALDQSRSDATRPVAVTVAEPVVTALVPSSSASVAAVAPSSSTSATSTSTSTTSTKPPGPRTTGARPPPPPAQKKCDIDYFFDSQGHKHFKPECVGN
jgi:hypothetical protein